MTCKCEHGCVTKAQLKKRHGTPAEFEEAVERAYADGWLDSYAAAHKFFTDYRKEYEAAP